MQYEISSEVEKVAKVVVKDHLTDLKSKKIVYVTQDKKDDKTGNSVAQMRKGKPIIGDVKLVGGLNAFLASRETRTDHDGPTPFAVLVVSRLAWEKLATEQRRAWVHQQLNRLEYNIDTGKPTLIDFDVKEFSIIAKLYGAWNDDLGLFLKTAKEHPLFEDLENRSFEPVAEPEQPDAEAEPKVVKGGNGKAVDTPNQSEAPKSDLPSIKDHVAKKRKRETASAP
jgi:putative metallopeptidase